MVAKSGNNSAKAETGLQYRYKCSENWFQVQFEKKKTVYGLTVAKSGTNCGKEWD